MKLLVAFSLVMLIPLSAFAQIPSVPPHAIYFMKMDGGYDLYIQKTNGVNSIVLTESQRDPAFKVTAYGLRSTVKSNSNAGEKRILDGRIVVIKDPTCYLIDSTPEAIPNLGEFYHFFLTDEVVFGYAWSRNGRLKIEPGVRINLRLFEKKFGDYAGRYTDQWIVLSLSPLPLAEEEAEPNIATELAKSESTIVLLHPMESENEIPEVMPQAHGETGGNVSRTAELIDRIGKQAEASSSACSSVTRAVVGKADVFPYEKLPAEDYREESVLKETEEQIILKTDFRTNDDGQKLKTGFSTFHFDEQQRPVLVNRYGADNQLLAAYRIIYDPAGGRPKIVQYDKNGQAIQTH